MRGGKVLVSVLFLAVFLFTGCTSGASSSVNDVTTEADTDDKTWVSRINPESMLLAEFTGLRETYGYEPRYPSDGEWMDSEGRLLFPYEGNEDEMEDVAGILASLYMPVEVLYTASTRDLLKVVCEGWLRSGATSALIYGTPSQYVLLSTDRIGAANELLHRSDMAEVVLEDYLRMDYVKKDGNLSEASYILDRIQFEEILLGSNIAFAEMDDTMRQQTIRAALKKMERAGDAEYNMGILSGFFAYIGEEQNNGGSDWYEYIQERGPEEAKKYLDSDGLKYWKW